MFIVMCLWDASQSLETDRGGLEDERTEHVNPVWLVGWEAL